MAFRRIVWMPLGQSPLPLFRPMRRGLTLAELMVVLAILAIVTAVTLPRLAGVRDWIAVDTAAHDVTAALCLARGPPCSHGTRCRAGGRGEGWGEREGT